MCYVQARDSKQLISTRPTTEDFPNDASLPVETIDAQRVLQKQRDLKKEAQALAKEPKPKGRPPTRKNPEALGDNTSAPKAKAKAKAKGKAKAQAAGGCKVSWLIVKCRICCFRILESGIVVNL